MLCKTLHILLYACIKAQSTMQQMVLEPSVPAVHTDDAKSDMWRYQRAEEIAVLQAAGLSEGRQILSEKYTEDADPLTASPQYGMWIKNDLYEDKDVDGYEIATRTRTGSQTCVLFETLTSIGLFHLPPLLHSQRQWVTASPYVHALQSLTCRCSVTSNSLIKSQKTCQAPASYIHQ